MTKKAEAPKNTQRKKKLTSIEREANYYEQQARLIQAKKKYERVSFELERQNELLKRTRNLHKAVKPTPYYQPKWDRVHINDTMKHEGESIRDQMRYLEANNPIVQAALSAAKTLYLGSDGITCEPRPLLADGSVDNKLAEEIQTKWQGFCINVNGSYAPCDIMTIKMLQEFMIVRSLVDGEVWVIINEDIENKTFTLHIKTSEYLSYNLNDPIPPLEFDSEEQIVAFNFRKPNKQMPTVIDPNSYIRVNAQDVAGFAHQREPRQFRGASPFASCAILLDQLDSYVEATVTNARINGNILGVVRDIGTGGSGYEEDFETYDEDQTLDLTNIAQNVTMITPPSGKTVEFSSGNGKASSLAEFIDIVTHQVAAALGVPHEMLSSRFSSSYSAARQSFKVGEVNYKRKVHDFVARVMRPIYRRFVRYLIDTGQLKNYSSETKYLSLFNAEYRNGTIPPIDPVKETKSLQMQVASGFTSISDASRQLGNNPRDVTSTLALDKQRFTEAGLTEIWNNGVTSTSAGMLQQSEAEETIEEGEQEKDEE